MSYITPEKCLTFYLSRMRHSEVRLHVAMRLWQNHCFSPQSQKQPFKVTQKHCPSWTLFLTKNISTSGLSKNQNTCLLGFLLLLFSWVLQHLISLMSLDWCFFLMQNVSMRHWFHKFFLRFSGKVKPPGLLLPSHFLQLNLNYMDNKLLAHQQWNWIILFLCVWN